MERIPLSKGHKVYTFSVTNTKLQDKLDAIKKDKTKNFSAMVEKILMEELL